MTQLEANKFVERMEEIGDEWTAEEAMVVYKNSNLQEALDDRMGSMNLLGKIINDVLNQ